MDSAKGSAGMDNQNSGRLVQNGAPRKDLHLKMTSADAEAGQDTSASAAAGDAVPLSPGGSSEAVRYTVQRVQSKSSFINLIRPNQLHR